MNSTEFKKMGYILVLLFIVSLILNFVIPPQLIAISLVSWVIFGALSLLFLVLFLSKVIELLEKIRNSNKRMREFMEAQSKGEYVSQEEQPD